MRAKITWKSEPCTSDLLGFLLNLWPSVSQTDGELPQPGNKLAPPTPVGTPPLPPAHEEQLLFSKEMELGWRERGGEWFSLADEFVVFVVMLHR